SPLNGGQIPPPPQSSKSHRGVWLIVALVVVLVAALVVVAVKKSKKATAPANQSTAQNNTSSAQPQAGSTRMVVADILATLPANLPVENNPKIVDSANLPLTNRNMQESYVSYSTAKTIDQNWAAFQKYFSDNQWKISSSTVQSNYKFVAADKGGNSLAVLLRYNLPTPPVNVVSLYYAYKP
ncbi:MAG: hypothetical protein KGJ93_05225, partial [Patescibacteria group bacterium]|nr:hypothetical protein [Patescibacteria group bacterium]